MELAILGTTQLHADEEITLAPGRETTLLVILALAAPHPVAVEVVAERLWDGDPPPKARQSLVSYVTRLRQTLERAGIDRSRLQFSSDSYALRVPVEIDWVRFQRLSRDAAALTEAGDEEAAASVLADALAMWRSEPLAEAVGAWAQAMRETMLGSYQAVLAQRAHLALRLGRPGAVIGDLQTAASAHPLSTKAWWAV